MSIPALWLYTWNLTYRVAQPPFICHMVLVAWAPSQNDPCYPYCYHQLAMALGGGLRGVCAGASLSATAPGVF
jgi:hypothetical protein